METDAPRLPNSEQQRDGRLNVSRRDFVKKAAYVPPAILTLAAAPAYAKNGSAKPSRPQAKKDKPKKDKD